MGSEVEVSTLAVEGGPVAIDTLCTTRPFHDKADTVPHSRLELCAYLLERFCASRRAGGARYML